jgi:NADP-dependent 3-hydroxy acid dehydrogenase YdfG
VGERSSLEQTVAIVTGASSGIGEATARRLSAEGAIVALVARRRDRLEALAAQMRAAGGQVLVVEADLEREESGERIVRTVLDEFGRLDTLVNNAGVMLLGQVRDAPLQEWRRMVDLNVKAPLWVTHAAVGALAEAAATSERGVADIVNISSIAGRTARANTAVYNLTKWGIGAFTEALRQELAPDFVRVSVVEPGATDTELRSQVRPEARLVSQARTAGVDRLAPSDIADAVAYIVTSPRSVAINEVMVRPSNQVF